jgi:hypothetical protein
VEGARPPSPVEATAASTGASKTGAFSLAGAPDPPARPSIRANVARRLRKLDREDREEESLVDLYLRALESASTPEVKAGITEPDGTGVANAKVSRSRAPNAAVHHLGAPHSFRDPD